MFCPECGTENPDNAKFCSECGTKLIFNQNNVDIQDDINLNDVLGFFEGGTSFKSNVTMDKNIKITPTELIVYKRSKISGKQKKNPKIYLRDKIENIELRRWHRLLQFIYDGKMKRYKILPKYFDEMEKILGIGIMQKQINGDLLMKARGYNGQLELYEHKIVIKREGFGAILLQGLKGDKEILINQISSIQFKKAGLTSGYIQFAFLGGLESKQGVFEAGDDENSVSFYSNHQREFEIIKPMIEERMIESKGKTQSSSDNGLENLEKLAELKEKGIITEEEFQAKKKQILEL